MYKIYLFVLVDDNVYNPVLVKRTNNLNDVYEYMNKHTSINKYYFYRSDFI